MLGDPFNFPDLIFPGWHASWKSELFRIEKRLTVSVKI